MKYEDLQDLRDDLITLEGKARRLEQTYHFDFSKQENRRKDLDDFRGEVMNRIEETLEDARTTS